MRLLIFFVSLFVPELVFSRNWNCTSVDPCDDILCGDTDYCQVNCIGNGACNDILIDCGNVTTCSIFCNNSLSCANSYVNGALVDELYFNTYANEKSLPPANDTSIECPESTDGNKTCEITCYSGDSNKLTFGCSGLNIYVKDGC